MPLLTNRRRFIQIAASASLITAAMSNNSALASGISPKRPIYKWEGRVLGGKAEILLPTGPEAEKLGYKIISEVRRLENIFSLYVPTSEISRLNREGILLNPSPEFYELLKRSFEFSKITSGAFDITVQPLWQYHSEIENYPERARERLEGSIRELVDYQALSIDSEKISFTKGGMAITLNGIAQGYITDRIAQLLTTRGFTNSLVNLGEIKAIGHHPTGREWKVNIAPPKNNFSVNPFPNISLKNGQAIATSSPQGTTLRDGSSHLLSPVDGGQKHPYHSLSVIAQDATTADALSTGFSLKSPQEIKAISSALGNIKVLALTKQGQSIFL